MPLDPKKLENRFDLADGMTRARCPACAENGHDKKGEHLRIYPDGRFGCCVYPKDREHRKRIYALAGERGRRGIQVRVAAAVVVGPVRAGILGRIGRAFGVSPSAYSTIGEPGGRIEAEPMTDATDATDGVGEVETQSPESRTLRTGETKTSGDGPLGSDGPRTLRTGLSNSKEDSAGEGFLPLAEDGHPRTLRTPVGNSRVYLEKVPSEEGVLVSTLKGFDEGVRGVREGEDAQQPPQAAEKEGGEHPNADQGGQRLPYLTPGGTLGIPFDAPERYHWWKLDGKRMSVKEIMAEAQARAAATGKECHGIGV